MYTGGAVPDASRASPGPPRPPGPAAQVASIGGRPPPGRGRHGGSGSGSSDDSMLGGSFSRPAKKSQTMTAKDIKDWQKVAPIPIGGAGVPPPINMNKARRPLPPKGGNAHARPADVPTKSPLGSSPVVPPGLGDILAKGLPAGGAALGATASGGFSSPTNAGSPGMGGSRKIPTGAVAVPVLAGAGAAPGIRPPLPASKSLALSPARAGSIGSGRPPPMSSGPHPPRPMSGGAQRPPHASPAGAKHGAPAPPPAPAKQEPKLTKEEKMRRTRDRVANEVVTTEKSYVESLDTLCELYIRPMSILAKDDQQCVFTEQDMGVVFSNISLITQLNQKFLVDLEKRVAKWDDKTCMGDLFLEFAPFFKMYTGYVSNHDKATQFLKKAEKSNAKFAEFTLKAVAEPRANGTNLSSFLIMPIQRIPRYKLLLQELVKNTEETHADYAALNKALEMVSVVATSINEAVKAQENRNAVLGCQEKFSGNPDLISPSRRFIRQGPLTKQCRSSDKAYEFFLFNDLLVYAEKNAVTRKYKLHRRMEINSSFFVQDLADKEEEKEKNRFQIISSQKSFIVYAADAPGKTEWLKDLYTCISSRRQAIGVQEVGEMVAPVWQSDSSSKVCFCCEKVFGIFNRRHHCRYCGNLVCQSCSTKRMIITGHAKGNHTQTLKGTPQRVCDKCVAQLQNTGNASKRDAAPEQPDKPVKDKKPDSDKGDGEESDSDDDTDLQQGATDIMSMKNLLGEKKKKDAAEKQAQYKAVYPYLAVEPEDLTFNEGDIIVVVVKDTSGWWKGYVEGTNVEGNFPSNYVVEIGDDYLTEIDVRVVATSDYIKRNDVELSLKIGDVIHVTSRDNSGWYYGTNDASLAGWFQSVHVEEMNDGGGGGGAGENESNFDTTSEYSAEMSISSRSTASSGLPGADDIRARIEHDFPGTDSAASTMVISHVNVTALHVDDAVNTHSGPPSPPSEPASSSASNSAHTSAPSSPSHHASPPTLHRVVSPLAQRPPPSSAGSPSSHHVHAASHDGHLPPAHPTSPTASHSDTVSNASISTSGAHPPPKPPTVKGAVAPPPPATSGGVPVATATATTSSGKQPPPKPIISRAPTTHNLDTAASASNPVKSPHAPESKSSHTPTHSNELTIQPPATAGAVSMISPSAGAAGAAGSPGHPPKPSKPKPPGHFANKPSKVGGFKLPTPKAANSPGDAVEQDASSSEHAESGSGAASVCKEMNCDCQQFSANMFKPLECKTCRHLASRHS